jgi:hypothetical protein
VISLVLLSLIAAEPAGGVVAVVKGGVSSSTGRQIAPGTRLEAGASIETGASGWAEVHLLGDVRVRIAAGSRIEIAKSSSTAAELILGGGRIWVQAIGREVRVRSAERTVRLLEPSSVILDHSARLGLSVIPRRGVAEVDGFRAAPGLVAQIDSSQSPPRLVPGGQAIADLVANEARAALGDPHGLRSFLIERSARAEIGRLDVRRVHEVIRTSPEILGTDGGSAAAMLEEALRPAPFFDREVPPKGPNVKVEVEFAE